MNRPYGLGARLLESLFLPNIAEERQTLRLSFGFRLGEIQQSSGADDRTLADFQVALNGVLRSLGQVSHADGVNRLGQHPLKVVNDQRVAVLDTFIIAGIDEGQWDDAEIDQVGQVNPLYAFGDDRAAGIPMASN